MRVLSFQNVEFSSLEFYQCVRRRRMHPNLAVACGLKIDAIVRWGILYVRTAGGPSYSLKFMREREWHVNKHEHVLRRLLVLRQKPRRMEIFIMTSEVVQWRTSAGIEERNVAFRVSFDAEDTSYAEFNSQPIWPSLRSQSQGCSHTRKTVADRSRLL